MTETPSSAGAQSTRSLSFRGMVAAMGAGIIGALIIWMVPGFIGLLPGLAPLTDNQLGYIASWDLNVMAVAIGASAFLLHRINWRWLVAAGLVLIAAGNVMTGLAHDYSTLVGARVVAGAGEGLAIGLAFAALGRAANPDRAFGIYLVAGAVFSSALLWVLPALQHQFGSALLFFANAALIVPVAVVLGWFPDGRLVHEDGHGPNRINWLLTITALVGVFFYFMAQGAMWGYLERIGQVHHIAEPEIGRALAIANFAGIGGAGLASLLPRGLGRSIPLAVSGVASVVAFQLLLGGVTGLVLLISAVVLTFAWNLSQPLLSGLCCVCDRQGRVVAAMGSIQTLGFGFGPAAAAMVLTNGNFAPVIWGSSLVLIFSLCVMLAGIGLTSGKSRAVSAKASS